MTQQIGIIGLGIMGSSIARNILAGGAAVAGFDVDRARMMELGGRGGAVAGSAAEVAGAAEIVLTSLPSSAALDATVDALAGVRRQGQIVCELSTLPIADKQRAHDRLAGAGIALLDCPLSGTGAQAVTRDLAVYASGGREAYDRVAAVFPLFSRVNHYLGAFGNGSRMKFIANHLVTIHNLASAEAFVLGEMAGLDPALVFDVIVDSAGSSRMFQIRGPMMVRGQYDEPTATMTTHLKDLDIIGKFAADLHCPTPLFTAAAQFYHAGVAQGRGGQDTGAVCAVLEKLAGIERKR
jgi:L-threonate 2-dehydrogenase